jgi:hypothetical protein
MEFSFRLGRSASFELSTALTCSSQFNPSAFSASNGILNTAVFKHSVVWPGSVLFGQSRSMDNSAAFHGSADVSQSRPVEKSTGFDVSVDVPQSLPMEKSAGFDASGEVTQSLPMEKSAGFDASLPVAPSALNPGSAQIDGTALRASAEHHQTGSFQPSQPGFDGPSANFTESGRLVDSGAMLGSPTLPGSHGFDESEALATVGEVLHESRTSQQNRSAWIGFGVSAGVLVIAMALAAVAISRGLAQSDTSSDGAQEMTAETTSDTSCGMDEDADQDYFAEYCNPNELSSDPNELCFEPEFGDPFEFDE